MENRIMNKRKKYKIKRLNESKPDDFHTNPYAREDYYNSDEYLDVFRQDPSIIKEKIYQLRIQLEEKLAKQKFLERSIFLNENEIERMERMLNTY